MRASLSPPLSGLATLLVEEFWLLILWVKKTNIREIGENPGPLDNTCS